MWKLLAILVAAKIPEPPANWWKDWKMSKSTTDWRTENRTILYKNDPVRIKGMNWGGFESNCLQPLGLWVHPIEWYLDLLVTHDFNTIRVPLPYEIMSDFLAPTNPLCSPLYSNMSTGALLHQMFDLCRDRNLGIILDLHTIGGIITPGISTSTVTATMVIAAWVNTIRHFGHHQNLIGIEIKNEPHGEISIREFETHVAEVIWAIKNASPDYQGLFLVSGVQIGPSPWGGHMSSVTDMGTTLNQVVNHPTIICTLNVTDRIVFTPHVYGTSVRGPGVAYEGTKEHDERFGFIWNEPNHWNSTPIVFTEIGGFLDQSDTNYYQHFLNYTQRMGMDNGIVWWELVPASSDTGGLLTDDYTTIIPKKLELIDAFVPHPTFFKF